MRKLTILTLICLLFSVITYSQGSVKGKLYDSVSRQWLSLATVTIFKAKDTAIITYRLTDPEGQFKVPNLPLNILLRAVITSSGYKVVRKEFTLDNNNSQLDWGTIHVQTDTSQLDEVLVIAERPPVSVKKDTIEFNASAFKTLPTALVEDLLKKLPGVEVDQDGNMRVNGRAVNRILVDGKDFFGGDPKVATKNLPANLIDKVQVVDDKEQSDRNPEINKQDLGQVINLKLKKSIKQGWFGKAYAGGGTGARTHYEAGAIVNSFRDTLQVSALAYTNNLNKSGFSLGDIEKLGGFGRSGYNSLSVWSDGGVEVNGISFGATGQGIQKSTGGGINLSHDPSKKLKINFQYFYGANNSDFRSISNTQQIFNDTALNTFTTTEQISDEASHNLALRLLWKPDSLSTFTFRPSLTFRNREAKREFTSESSSSYEPLLNESINQQHSNGKENNYSQEFSYNRLFKKKGRVFNLFTNLNASKNSNDQYNNVETIFYNGQSTTSKLDQLRDREYDNINFNSSVSWSEPINKKFSARFYNNLDYFQNDDIVNTFDWNPTSSKYELLNTTLSNGLMRKGLRNATGASIIYRHKKLTITPGVYGLALNIDNDYQKGNKVSQRYYYVYPSLNLNYGSFNLGYRVNVREPSAIDLRPVVDNTNPLYQSLGNPELLPTIAHSINGGMYKYDSKRMLNINMYLNLNIEKNTIVRERTVSDKGVQITNPINVDGVWNWNSSLFLSKQYKLYNNWQLSVRPAFSFSYNRNFVIVNNNRSRYEAWNTAPSMNLAFNWKDLFEISQRYSLSYRDNKYQSEAFRDASVTTHYVTSEIVVRLPKNWVWESSIDYRNNPQVSPGISKNIVRWHGGINYLFLKDQKGQLKLYVYDILKQNTNAFRMVAENYIQDTESNALTRYFLLTFTYNIRDFKAGKVGGRQSMFFF